MGQTGDGTPVLWMAKVEVFFSFFHHLQDKRWSLQSGSRMSVGNAICSFDIRQEL